MHIQPSARHDYCLFSNFPRTWKKWNLIPSTTREDSHSDCCKCLWYNFELYLIVLFSRFVFSCLLFDARAFNSVQLRSRSRRLVDHLLVGHCMTAKQTPIRQTYHQSFAIKSRGTTYFKDLTSLCHGRTVSWKSLRFEWHVRLHAVRAGIPSRGY